MDTFCHSMPCLFLCDICVHYCLPVTLYTSCVACQIRTIKRCIRFRPGCWRTGTESSSNTSRNRVTLLHFKGQDTGEHCRIWHWSCRDPVAPLHGEAAVLEHSSLFSPPCSASFPPVAISVWSGALEKMDWYRLEPSADCYHEHITDNVIVLVSSSLTWCCWLQLPSAPHRVWTVSWQLLTCHPDMVVKETDRSGRVVLLVP